MLGTDRAVSVPVSGITWKNLGATLGLRSTLGPDPPLLPRLLTS